MITKGFTPKNGAKVFAIMKHPQRFHDREDFNTPWRRILRDHETPSRKARRGPARPDAGHKTTFARLRHAAKSPYFETLT
jgi:hypothetical protein